MQEAIDIWEQHQPDSGQEMWDLALEQGAMQGWEKGVEKGARERSCQIAIRMMGEGYSDREIETLTQLSSTEITQLKNGAE